MTDPLSSDEVAARLIELREQLVARIWHVAIAAAQTADHEHVRDLVKLKVDIEAIDFALSHRPAVTNPGDPQLRD